MASSIINEIAAELQTLEQELKEFKTAVAYLKDAKDSVKSAVEAVNKAEGYHLKNLNSIEQAYARLNMVIESVGSLTSKIDNIDFPARLATIENSLDQVVKSIDESAKTTLNQLAKASEVIANADFNGKFKKLDDVVSSSISGTHKALEVNHKSASAQVEKLEKAIRVLEESQGRGFRTQQQFFQELALGRHFEDLDVAIKELASKVQHIQRHLDLVEVGFKNRIQDCKDTIITKLDFQSRELKEVLARNERLNKMHFYFTWVGIMVLFAVIIAFKLFPKLF